LYCLFPSLVLYVVLILPFVFLLADGKDGSPMGVVRRGGAHIAYRL
jgi:hypothetical protein